MKSVQCHKLVFATAEAMAHELYDDVMRDNALWDHWKKCCPELSRDLAEGLFVSLIVPKLVEPARATLAGLLRTTGIDDTMKDEIASALILDAQVRRSDAFAASRRRRRINLQY